MIYVPLCLFEIKMSPQLHQLVYGYHQHGFDQTIRLGGFRPMVFMQHGLAVGFWMTAASLIGVWLLVSGSLKQLWGIPMIVIVPILLVTTSSASRPPAIGFLFIGIARALRDQVDEDRVAAVLPDPVRADLHVRRAPRGVVDRRMRGRRRPTEIFGEDRAPVARDAHQRREPAHRARDEAAGGSATAGGTRTTPATTVDGLRRRNRQDDARIPDGMWVITLAINGLVGFVALTTSILLPAAAAALRVPPRWWAHPMAAPAAACAVMLTLHMVDNLLNAMINPIFICAIGGLSAWA